MQYVGSSNSILHAASALRSSLSWVTAGLMLVVCLTPTIIGLTSAQDCPLGWETWGDHCYQFVFYPVREYTQASAACQLDSAYLLSVNSNEEHHFVSKWLTVHDMNRETSWWTSGVGDPDTLRWEGDGTQATLDQSDKWTSDTELNLQSNLHVVYSFTTESNSYLWSRQSSSIISPYVCEISAAQAFRITQARRDFTFGTNTTEPELALRGPQFTIEPQSVVVVGRMESVSLECDAEANPPPSYVWYKIDVIGDVGAVTTETDSRYSLTNGRLRMQDPDAVLDEGDYYCQATNTFGTIITHTVAVAFGYLGEFSNDPPGSVRALQYQGTYLECRPPLHNPILVYQWYKGPGANFVRTDLNEHVFISSNGRLYFSETQMADAGFYHCVVTLVAPLGQTVGTDQAPSRTSMGIELIIHGDTATQFGPLMHNDFPAVFPTPALRGVTLRLECFAYGRLPLTYNWFRDNGPLPQKARMLEGEQKRVLLIPDAQLEDSGNYTCRVERGTRASAEKSLALIVEAVPFFAFPLRDQHVDVGTTFTLLCQAVAVPLPTYKWYKNGQHLTSNPGSIEVQVNVVTFHSADPALHDGMYQCEATNVHGTNLTSAQVRVLEFTPSFLKKPLHASQMGTVGGSVTILCQPEAAPVPNFTWSHNGRPLDLTPGAEGRLMLLDNGNLLITQVQQADQGQYTCTAENSVGSASSSGILTVYEATTLTMRPSNTEVLGNDTAFLACQASADQTHTELAYRWTFNGHLINNDKDPHYRMAEHHGLLGLYIINAQFRHDGTYQCGVLTVDHSITAEARLVVKGPPSEPAGVFFDPTSSNDVHLFWSPGETHGSPIIAYVIEFKSNFRPEWRVKVADLRAADAVNADYPDKLTWTITDLSPGSDYNFRVRAINQFGIGEPSLPSPSHHVPDAAPLVAPENIRYKLSTVGTLSFEWDRVSDEDLTGEGRGYRAFWRKKDSNQYRDSKWETADVDAYTSSYVALVGMENYWEEYEVKVAAFNSLGRGPNSTVAIVMSQEDMPLATPEHVWAERVNSTAITAHWAPLNTSRPIMRGKFLGVVINWWRLDEPGRMFGINIYCDPEPAPCVEGMVIGLDPNTFYWVNLQVFTNAGMGTQSERFLVQTVLDAPRTYPEYVSVSSMEGKRVYVKWRGIIIGRKESPLQGYKLWWWPATEGIRTANVTVVEQRKQNWAVVDGIKEGTLYALRVLGYSSGGDGKKSPTVYFTLEGQVEYNPQTTEVLATGTHSKASLRSVVGFFLLLRLML